MARASLISTSFANGEISPLLYGRIDLAPYQNSVRQLENFLVTPQGAITRRPGTVFVNEVKDSSKNVRLIGFQFSTVQAYVLEFGDLYIRFYKDNGLILEANKNITAATKANPCVITSAAHGFSNGDEVYISSVVGMTELNGRYFTVANKTTDTFELSGVNSSAYTTYVSGGTVARVYEIATPYAHTVLENLDYTSSADTMYILCPSIPVRKLTRTGHTSWTLTTETFEDGPYEPENTDETITLSPSAPGTIGGTITVTASKALFVAGDVGRAIYIKNGVDDADGDYDDRGNGTITAFTSSTVVTVTVHAKFKTGAVDTWALGCFHGTDWPRAATFYEQRLWYAGDDSHPQSLYASVSAEYEHFGGSESLTLDTDGLSYTIGSDQVNSIQWLVPLKVLLVGTTGDEFSVSASSLNEAITPTNIKITPEGSEGSAKIRPIKIGNSAVYVQSTKRRVMEVSYAFDVDRYVSSDLTVFADHICYPYITEIAYQRQPYRIVWAVRSDGQLLGCTYYKEQKVVGWHRHILGGTNSKVKSIATIQGAYEDQLWMVVERTIDGQTRKYVEYLDEMFRNKTVNQAHFVDSGLKYSGAAVSTLTGALHLANESISININGSTIANRTISATGALSLPIQATTASIGFGYTSLVETNNIEGGASQGTSQTAVSRIHEVGIRFYETVGAKYGPDEDNLTVIPFRTTTDDMDTAVPLFTGDKVIKFTGGYTREPRVVVVQDQPLPMTISCMVYRISVAEI